MEKTHATLTDQANADALALRKACRFEEAAARLLAFLDAGHPLTAVEQLRTRNNLAMLARDRGLYRAALSIHSEAEPYADACRDPLVRGKFHNGRALTHQKLGDPDAAILEFTAAAYHHEKAGAHRERADIENNLAVILVEAGRVAEAMEHLALALGSCADEAVRAQYEDTRALIALAAGDGRTALEFSYASVERLRRVGDAPLLAQSARTLVRAGRAYLRELEERRVRETLEACEWSLTRAYPCLGFNSRQALENHLKRNFPRLDEERRNKSVASPDGP